MTATVKYIYEDEDILICHKPSGMATEGAGAGKMDLVSSARNYLARKNRNNTRGRQRNLPPYVATVNRLDSPVEGVLVLAKNKRAAGSLSSQIKDHSAGKYYYALCYGAPEKERGRLDDFIIRREDTGLAFIITAEEKATFSDGKVTLSSGEKVRLIGGEVKDAALTYEVLAKDDKISLLNIHLLTGRFHQIRAQLSHLGCPILGDERYESAESGSYSKEHGIRGVCLVCYSFAFVHPATEKEMTFTITPDNPTIREILDKKKEDPCREKM